MTREQFDRWREFSLAMAERGWASMTASRSARVRQQVDRYFQLLDADDSWVGMRSWDESDGTVYCAGDDFSEFAQTIPGFWQLTDDQWETWRFRDQIECCIRAGMDVASEPSAGVVGFNVGDLRRMFGGTIPEWVDATYEGRLATAADTEGVWL